MVYKQHLDLSCVFAIGSQCLWCRGPNQNTSRIQHNHLLNLLYARLRLFQAQAHAQALAKAAEQAHARSTGPPALIDEDDEEALLAAAYAEEEELEQDGVPEPAGGDAPPQGILIGLASTLPVLVWLPQPHVACGDNSRVMFPRTRRAPLFALQIMCCV